jgi:hypothetical protein
VYVIHSRTHHGEWKSAEFADEKIAKDFADALITAGFVVRFLTRTENEKQSRKNAGTSKRIYASTAREGGGGARCCIGGLPRCRRTPARAKPKHRKTEPFRLIAVNAISSWRHSDGPFLKRIRCP